LDNPHALPAAASAARGAEDYAPCYRREFLLPRYWGVWAALALLRLAHLLPRRLTAFFAARLGDLYFLLSAKRRRIARINLQLCFPEWSRRQRRRCLRRHFRVAAQCAFDYGLLWWAPRAKLNRLVRLVGVEHYQSWHDQGRHLIVLTAHFMALEIGAAVLEQRYRGFGLIKPARNKLIDWYMTRGRMRIGEHTQLFLRARGLRPVVRAIKQGLGFYYLPDEDFGPEQSVFVPFLGTQAATLTTLGRLARLTQAVVIPVSSRVLPGGRGYEVHIRPALENFPTDDETADAARMNAVLAEEIRARPEQYLWTFKLFKTRPDNAPSPYARR